MRYRVNNASLIGLSLIL